MLVKVVGRCLEDCFRPLEEVAHVGRRVNKQTSWSVPVSLTINCQKRSSGSSSSLLSRRHKRLWASLIASALALFMCGVCVCVDDCTCITPFPTNHSETFLIQHPIG